MKNKRVLFGLLALVLLSTIGVVSCETEDKGPLGGTKWTRTVDSSTSTMTIHWIYDLTFTDASNASIYYHGYTRLNGKTDNKNETTTYTYTYSSKTNVDGWQGSLKPKSGGGVGYVFKISGNKLTSMTSSGTVEWTKK